MSKLTVPNVDYNFTEKNLLVDPRLKICTECGQSSVENYEFGISCEFCGTLLIFNPQKAAHTNWRTEK
ncbi:MAG: hypothetical protein GTN97_02100 [Nitrosopumilaceae archaeon]|nr:hypothetical protein [Nitrosopumilaceae archaeon]NIP09944.1 hypothetical protein [Nitrosopumilaceae archaeon]NIS94715.1 hypothetical protein [Nitrosopumilaceae archaeon]